MKTTKIVHILYSGLGGHGTVLFTLLENKFLESCEHHVIFVGVEEPRTEYIERCQALNIPWHYVARIAGQDNIHFIYSLFKILQWVDAELVFSHSLAATPSLALYRIFSCRKCFFVLRETQAHHLKRLQEWIFLLLANWVFDRIVYLTEEARIGAKAKLRFF